MSRPNEQLDHEERAREKQRARDEDERALQSGEKSAEELRRENHLFGFPKVKIHIDPDKLY